MDWTERPRVAVIGTGYLGATHAVGMAELGYDVIGLDIDQSKVERLRGGEVPFFEPELPALLGKHLDSGRLRFTSSLPDVVDFADIHFVCVGTPQTAGGLAADVTSVERAFAALARLATRPTLLVGKSTVPAGTAARMAELVQELAPLVGVEVAWNPEFLREGTAVRDTLCPDRLVFGVQSPWAEDGLRAAYRPAIEAGTPVVVTDLATAELVKVAANAFLATKISFINAMADVCDAVGADVTVLADALGHDARIGRRFLSAGLGYGGGCLPKDIRAFTAHARELGADHAVRLMTLVDDINRGRRARTVSLGADMLGGNYRGKRVGILGASFKPDSDDIRESPALDVAVAVHELGAEVTVYDPQAMGNARSQRPQLTYASSAALAMRGADLVMLLTEWPEFRALDASIARRWVGAPNILDGRGALDPAQWRVAGWTYRALGRP